MSSKKLVGKYKWSKLIPLGKNSLDNFEIPPNSHPQDYINFVNDHLKSLPKDKLKNLAESAAKIGYYRLSRLQKSKNYIRVLKDAHLAAVNYIYNDDPLNLFFWSNNNNNVNNAPVNKYKKKDLRKKSRNSSDNGSIIVDDDSLIGDLDAPKPNTTTNPKNISSNPNDNPTNLIANLIGNPQFINKITQAITKSGIGSKRQRYEIYNDDEELSDIESPQKKVKFNNQPFKIPFGHQQPDYNLQPTPKSVTYFIPFVFYFLNLL